MPATSSALGRPPTFTTDPTRGAIPDCADRAFRRFLASGDSDDFGRFFQLTVDTLRRQAARLVSDNDTAEDLVQSTFIAAVENSHLFDDARRVVPWLQGILLNRARQLMRVRSRLPDPGRLPIAPEPHDPARLAERRDLAAAVRTEIAYLPRPYQAVLALHFGAGLSPAEISSSLNRRRSTVRTQLVRGLQYLRVRLRELGLISA